MARTLSLTDLIARTAVQKSAVARARLQPSTVAEKPREAIFDGLQIVGSSIGADGYIFIRSGPKFTRKKGNLSFQINVQSDRNNVAGQRAAIWVHAAVYSRNFTAWSKNHSSEWIRPNAPFPLPVFGCQLGYLCELNGWMEWDFADQATRQDIANDLTTSIRTGAYRLFAAFESGVEDVAKLEDRDRWSPEGILSYLLCMGRPDMAAEVLQGYLDHRPQVRSSFEQFKKEFKESGIPKCRTGEAHDLAAFAVATGYPWNA